MVTNRATVSLIGVSRRIVPTALVAQILTSATSTHFSVSSGPYFLIEQKERSATEVTEEDEDNEVSFSPAWYQDTMLPKMTTMLKFELWDCNGRNTLYDRSSLIRP